MKNVNILRNNETVINVEYNSDKYSICYEGYEDWLILKRNRDNKVVFIFDNDLRFIVECDINKKSNFIVSNYVKNKNGYSGDKIRHYMDNGGATLELIREFNTYTGLLDYCRLADNCFLVDDDYSGGKIYNLNRISKKYSSVQPDAYLDDNTMKVSEEIHSSIDKRITDTITYSINLNTYEIMTPVIYSDLQNKEINIYNERKIYSMDLDDIKFLENSKDCSIDEINPFDITVYCEVTKHLNKLAIEKSKSFVKK